MKVNLGCGPIYLEGWLNVDSDPDVRADVYEDGFEFVRRNSADIDELFLGHVLEHLRYEDAAALLRMCASRMPPGSVISAVTPDMRAIFSAYLDGEITNLWLNEAFVYSYVQPSHHQWCHDEASLADLFKGSGLQGVQPVDVTSWEPVAYKHDPWQCGVRGQVPGPDPRPDHASDDAALGAAASSVAPPDAPGAEQRTWPAPPVGGTLLAAVGQTPPKSPTAELLERLRTERLTTDRLRHATRREQREIAALREQIQHQEQVAHQLEEMRHRAAAVDGSRAWQMVLRLRRSAGRALPRTSRRRRLVGRIVRRLQPKH